MEFGGYSYDEGKLEREADSGGDLRIMGIDVRDQKIGYVDGHLVSLVLSDSTVKVSSMEASTDNSYISLLWTTLGR